MSNKKPGLIGKILKLIGKYCKVECDYKDSSVVERSYASQNNSENQAVQRNGM